MDMGGTSFDVALIQDGRYLLSTENRLEEAVFNVPMLDITTIGAGGGSIAWLDNAGKLRVGPQSAGAQPPVRLTPRVVRPRPSPMPLFASAGSIPTTSWVAPCAFMPGQAERAIHTHIATPLGMSVLQAAAGLYRIVNANMAGAARLVSVAKGYDPRDFALLAFGGAGPLHAVAIAEELEIPGVVPRYPGMTSAAGLVVADIVHNFVQTRPSCPRPRQPF